MPRLFSFQSKNKPRARRERMALHEVFAKLAEGQTVDAISWTGSL
jgi:hypothetical protein